MRIVYKVLLMSILLAPVLMGCKSKFDEHYERPGWLRGTASEALKSRGNYSIFLRGVELTKFSDLLEGQGLCTVFAPNDEKFAEYLEANGWASIEEVPLDQLSTLIGFHLVQYSYGKVQLTNYDPGGANNATAAGPGGLYYKQKTYGRSPLLKMEDPSTGREVNVFMREKYLPILSKRLITAKSLTDYKYNFSTMYPNSEWAGDGAELGTKEGRVYAANGYVINDGLGLPTDNGYLYLVGEVLEPLDNIHTVMTKNANLYSTFTNLYDKFATLTYDAVLSRTYGETSNDSLYLFFHGRHASSVTYAPKLAQIASEWTFNKEQNMPYHQGFSTGRAFNAFVPDNSSLETFVSSFFSDFSLSNLPLIQTYYLVSSHVLDNSPVSGAGATLGRKGVSLPEEVRLGRISNAYGDVMQVDLENSPVRQYCTNGTFYGTNTVTIPAPFRSVSAPVFQRANYSIFLMMLYQTGNILQLTNPDVNYTLFVPTDEAFTSAGIAIKDGDPKILGDEKIQVPGGSGSLDVTIPQLNNLVDMHILFQRLERTEFNTKKVYPAKRSGTYIKVFNGGVSGETDLAAATTPAYLGDYYNGIVYELSSVLERTTNNLASILSTTTNCSKYWALLQRADLTVAGLSGDLIIPSIGGEYVMIFAPVNSAIDADTVIPVLTAAIDAATTPEDLIQAKKDLADYLKSYIVSIQKSRMNEPIMIGIGQDGTYVTDRVREKVGSDNIYFNINLSKDVANFRIKLEVTQVDTSIVKTAYTASDMFPQFATDGIVYQIETTDIQPKL